MSHDDRQRGATAPRDRSPRASTQGRVTLYFWVIKILCTTVGETAADYLNTTLGFGLSKTTFVMSALLAATLVFQFRLRRSRRQPADEYDDLRDRLGSDVWRLVCERENPLDPHDRHDQARGVLLV